MPSATPASAAITPTAATTGGNPTVTEELRYKIDDSDKAITEDPENHREIGISIVVTPTLLPDGTVRMKLRPRSAQIVAAGRHHPRGRAGGVDGVHLRRPHPGAGKVPRARRASSSMSSARPTRRSMA